MALTKDEIMDIPLKFFGLPDERKFPMHDDIHLKAAIGYFYTASNDKRNLILKLLERIPYLNLFLRI